MRYPATSRGAVPAAVAVFRVNPVSRKNVSGFDVRGTEKHRAAGPWQGWRTEFSVRAMSWPSIAVLERRTAIDGAEGQRKVGRGKTSKKLENTVGTLPTG